MKLIYFSHTHRVDNHLCGTVKTVLDLDVEK